MCVCRGLTHPLLKGNRWRLNPGSPLLLSLEHSRNQSVRNGVCVAFPVFPVLAAAAVFVAHAAVDQQDGHVNDVEVRQYVAEPAGGAVSQRAHQVPGVVEVAGHAPEA